SGGGNPQTLHRPCQLQRLVPDLDASALTSASSRMTEMGHGLPVWAYKTRSAFSQSGHSSKAWKPAGSRQIRTFAKMQWSGFWRIKMASAGDPAQAFTAPSPA